ncbi:hypothetical protein CSW25_08415 [Thermus scotoductus]|uniref:Annexin VII n=1 Tax=Thermus scotoductus TaxID=37636 RepID=A0A430S710_THESC|nr:hypothetical protein [Thermus scotoductus]RTG94210.1 hypothetical protein CSW48_09110 [Thermus scotoductus]RTH07449.1 hypothetical protein CSW46_09900 [Thermus scotoductus]RTH08521.1 hypothetical protein CSW43_13160 [Thermus scotoductus]RTH10933.1 hypothetical protein CSW44_06470 [Thermus scotoductus]RTH16297.1 hypothetical protein CSW39_09635 [Thermus scotoductus]
MEYDEMPYAEAKAKAVKVWEDGYGDAVILKDAHGYWALYYFYGFQAPPPTARPHWMEGPVADPATLRPPYAVKRFLEEQGDFDYLNDVD